jgi:hypothetical protein
MVDLIKNGEVALLVNTPLGKKSQYDDYALRRAALRYEIPYITTTSGALASASGIAALRRERLRVRALQDWLGAGVPARPDRPAAAGGSPPLPPRRRQSADTGVASD